SEAAAERSHQRDRDRREKRALQDADRDCQPKERSAPGAIVARFSPGDESGDRVVETEDADLAYEIGRGPRHGKNAERRRTEKPRHEKSEDAAKVRCEHRGEVRARAALQFRPGIGPALDSAGWRDRPE